MSIPYDLLSRCAPIVMAIVLIAIADRVGGAGPLGPAAAAAVVFGTLAVVGARRR